MIRPSIDADPRYDLDIKLPKDKRWRYVSSSNYPEDFTTDHFKQYKDYIVEHKGLWRIIDSKKGSVITTNDRTLQSKFLPLSHESKKI